MTPHEALVCAEIGSLRAEVKELLEAIEMLAYRVSALEAATATQDIAHVTIDMKKKED